MRSDLRTQGDGKVLPSTAKRKHLQFAGDLVYACELGSHDPVDEGKGVMYGRVKGQGVLYEVLSTMPTTTSPGDLTRLMTKSPDDLTMPTTGTSELISHDSGKNVTAPTKKICRRSVGKGKGLSAPSGGYLEMDTVYG